MDIAETSSKVEAWYADATTVNPPKGERFAAVEFSAENGLIAEVPVTWLRGKRIGVYLSKKAVVGKCYWPPKLLEKKVRKLAENQVQPDKTTWELYDVVVLNYGGTFADVVEATKAISGKESEADNSDSSVEEPLAARRERAKKHRKRRSSPMSGGSDSGCDELDTSHLNMNEGSKSDQGAEPTPSQSSTQVEKAGSSKSGKSPLKTPRKTPTKSVTITTPGKTPQKQGGDSKKTTPKKTPQKQGVSDNSEDHTRHEVGPFATAMLPFKRSLPMVTLSPSKKANLSKTTFSSSFPKSRPLTLSTEAPKKQKQMTNYISSISERETSILEDELDSMELSQNIFDSPSSIRSASPAASDASEGPFKTPREKSAYRSLTYSSPSDGSGMRVIVRTLGELQEQLMKMEKLHKDSAESVAKTMAKILSCVQPAIETNIAEDIPRLPLSEKDNEDKLNKMLMSTDQFNKVVTFLHGLGGSNPRDAVYNVMKTIFTDAFASTKSMKGIKRTNHPAKDAFMGTQLFKAVMCAVRRRFRDTSVSEVIELTGNWLKDAPSREKKRQRRKEAREELLREYEDTDIST